VINTYNRAASLRTTLEALRHQTYREFEVVVVDGPSDDGTPELLAARAGAVRAVDCPERNLSVSRNLGIDAAAGEVVAFVDDDAIPEARWLEDLAAAYTSPRVGGAGGLTLDNTGVRVQYRYSVCNRIGLTDFDQRPPFDCHNRPGADPFVYLQGTNCSFRRTALVDVEGFDEEIEYNYDESEVCSRIIDSGLELRPLENAVVHHHFLPSHMRRSEGFTDPYLPIKNRVYFALRVGRDHRPMAETVESLTRYLNEVKAFMRDAASLGRFSETELEHFVARADAGFALGMERGMAGVRRGRTIHEPDPDAFLPYPVLVPEGRRLAVCFVSMDYPPRPVGGVGRYTHDLARGFAAAGHEAHVVTRDDAAPYRADYEEGVWVHRFPVASRWTPELDVHVLKGNLDHLAAMHSAVERVADRVPLDIVTGSTWVAEPLLCALSDRWITSAVCVTPMRKIAETQPETAAAPLTPGQIELEDALLRSPARLQPISSEVAELCAAVTDAPMEVVWLGTADRRPEFPRSRDDAGVEILFTGRLEPRKGLDTLLEAGAELLRAHPQVRLRVCGPDNPHANGRPGVFQDWVASHAEDVAPRIRFDGLLSDDELMQAYADCDVFCAPSRYESFGLVQVEAMMMQRPVVACDAGGMRETVVDGETGLLIAPGDVFALRAALERLVDDGDLRSRMGAAGRARYEREFRLDVAVVRHARRFERLLDEPGRPGGGALPALLEDLCGLDADTAKSVADTLLDPARFPEDLVAGVRRALARDDAGLVDGLFQTLLGREPNEEGLAAYTVRLAAGEDRYAVVSEIATSTEARHRDIDVSFLDHLPELSSTYLLRGLVSAWALDDDAEFVRALHVLLGGTEPPQPIPPGVSRQAYVRDLLRRPGSGRRLDLHVLPDPAVLRSTSEMAAELRALAGSGDAEFLDAAYRLLLGREPDPPGRESYLRFLRQGGGRDALVREMVSSAEGSARGLPPEIGARLGAAAGGARRRFPRAQRTLARLGEVMTRSSANRASVEAAVAGAEQRLERAIANSSAHRRLEVLDRNLIERVEALDRESRAALAGQGTILAERLDALSQLQVDQMAADGASGVNLSAARNTLAELQAQLDIMRRKHEAMAMDVREKLPSPELDDVPEPEIPDHEALSRRIEEIGGVRLNLGCGEKPLPDYINVDFRPLPGVHVVADVRRLPFEPGTVDEIASHHLIEHFREHHAEVNLLPYWRSLLGPGGILRTVTPNWAVLIDHVLEGRLTFQQFKLVTFGAQDYSGDDHFALYSPETLQRLLEAAGFSQIEILEHHRQNGLSPEMEILARPAVRDPALDLSSRH